jgi:hypothetical protein
LADFSVEGRDHVGALLGSGQRTLYCRVEDKESKPF